MKSGLEDSKSQKNRVLHAGRQLYKVFETNGMEVTKNIFNISENAAKGFPSGERKIKKINKSERNFVCLPHPGILMKNFDRNPWPKLFKNEIAPKVKELVSRIRNNTS